MLFKKMLRDLLHNKSQFITIFIMVFIAVFAFAGVHAYMDGMTESSKEYYENNNLEDLWVFGEEGFSKEDLEKIKSLDNVNNAERVLAVNASVGDSERFTNDGKQKAVSDMVLELNFIETNEISKMAVIEGEEYSEWKKGLWLDYYLANNMGIKLGEELELTLEGYTFKEKIVGLVETPDHVYSIKDDTAIFPTHTDYGYAYLSINEFPVDYIYDKILNSDELKNAIKDFSIEDAYVFPEILVDLKDTSLLKETKQDIENNIEDITAISDRDTNLSVQTYQGEIEEGNTYSGVFTGLFVFIAILSVVTTMNRFIKKERTQIGTLKALGIKRRKITGMYVGYGLFISVLASVFGFVVGNIVLGETFLKLQHVYYEVPTYHIVTGNIVWYVIIAIILVITLVTYLSCRKVLKEPAAEALRTESPNAKVKKNSITTKGFFNKLSLSTRWNIRDIARSKGRTIMAFVGIMGSTLLIVTAIGMMDSMKSYISWEFDTICNFEYKLTLASDYTDKELNDLISTYGASTSQTATIEFKSKDEKILNTLTINNTEDMLQVTDHDRNPFKMQNDGIYVTEKLAKKYDWKIGDEVEWHIVGEDKWYTTKIAGLNRDPQNQSFSCTKVFFDTLGDYEYKADSLYTNDNLSNVKTIPGVNTIQTVGNLKDGINSMMSMMYTMVFLLIFISIALAVDIIYNLGVLSFSEKEYQFATLKVLGFKNKSIKDIFIKQNLWIAFVSILAGLPAGNWMTDYIFKNAIAEDYDFSAMIKPITFIGSAIGAYIVCYIINQFLGRKVKKIDMVTSLKGNE